MQKQTILTYNISTEEKQTIINIFQNLNINIEIIPAKCEEDIIATPCFMSFIKLPQEIEKINTIKEIEKVLNGYQFFIYIDNNFQNNTQKIQQQIQYNYQEYINKKVYYNDNHMKDGIVGFAIGDALGVPAEFKTREYLKQNPITTMVSNGTYNVPKGTWSDDTSMTLATIDSIIQTKTINTNDIATKFLQWFRNIEYTATGDVFDIGRTTLQALAHFELDREDAENCGRTGEYDNGNGSLMRMLPIAYYIYYKQISNGKLDEINDKEVYNIVKKVSSITHAHEISVLGCYIFVRFAIEIISDKYKSISYENIKKLDYSFFSKQSLEKYSRILNGNIQELNIDEIKSSGYIVDTLEAVFWVFLNGNDYNTTVLRAVNLGEDTDTVAAITGGLLGSYYGIENINDDWKKDLKRIDYIEKLCNNFHNSLK